MNEQLTKAKQQFQALSNINSITIYFKEEKIESEASGHQEIKEQSMRLFGFINNILLEH